MTKKRPSGDSAGPVKSRISNAKSLPGRTQSSFMSEKILSPSARYLHGGGFSVSPSVANIRSLSGLALLHAVHNTEHEVWHGGMPGGEGPESPDCHDS